MGYTLQLQWSFTPPSGRVVPLVDIICGRVLEHYNLDLPARSSLQLRTFRGQFPSSEEPRDSEIPLSTRYLTIISSLEPPVPPGQSQPKEPSAKDDTAYLFLDDRSVTEDQDGSTQTTQEAIATAKESRYQCLAVRPSSAVGPMFQSLLSPFVMGVTKAARTAASQTSSTPIPTPLPGTTLILNTFTFSPPLSPAPPVTLRLYILPSASAGSILLEGEYSGPTKDKSQEDIERIVREFLEECLVSEIGGDIKWISIPAQGRTKDKQWRDKQSILALATALRQGNFI